MARCCLWRSLKYEQVPRAVHEGINLDCEEREVRGHPQDRKVSQEAIAISHQ